MSKKFIIVVLSIFCSYAFTQQQKNIIGDTSKTFMIVRKVEMMMTVRIPDFENADLNEYLNMSDAVFARIRASSEHEGDRIAHEACRDLCTIEGAVHTDDLRKDTFVGQVVKFSGEAKATKKATDGGDSIDLNAWQHTKHDNEQKVLDDIFSSTIASAVSKDQQQREQKKLESLWHDTVLQTGEQEAKDKQQDEDEVLKLWENVMSQPNGGAAGQIDDTSCVCVDRNECSKGDEIPKFAFICNSNSVCCKPGSASNNENSRTPESFGDAIFPGCGVINRNEYFLATTNKSPWVAMVISRTHGNKRSEFDAVIIHPRAAITLYTNIIGLQVFSTIIKAGENTFQPRKLSDMVKHPNYDANKIANNLAVLKWKLPLKIDVDVLPACVPNSFKFANEFCFVTFWRKYPENLKVHFKTKLFDTNQCSMGEICAQHVSPDACMARGSPVVCTWPSEKVAFVGLTTTESQCANSFQLVDVSLNYNWIASQLLDVKEL